MSEIKTRQVSVVEEKRIITGLIVSTPFLNKVYPILQLDYFTNSYLKTIATWCTAFYEEHKNAPYRHIQDIYEDEALRLNESESELIKNVLQTISDQYVGEDLNVEYLTDCAVTYFKKRELEITLHNIEILKEKGDLEGAEEELQKYTKVDAVLNKEHFIDLGDIKKQEEIYRQIEEDDKRFFQLPGDLGKYLGNMKRGDVVGYYAPAKRGKCVSGNAFIYLSDGRIMKLKDVVQKKIKNILCVDKKGKVIEGEVVGWHKTGIKTEYEITVKSGRKITTSKYHRFLTPTGWKRLYELSLSDRIALCKQIPNKANNSNRHVSRYTFRKVVGDCDILNTDILWDSIVSIKQKNKIEMFDLSIKKNHNFIANSFVVHNSWVLGNHFKYGILKRKRTIFWSIEMTRTEIVPRLNQAFHPMVTGNFEEGYYMYPVFDCELNQLGDCAKRESEVIVKEEKGPDAPVIIDPNHIPCTKCKYTDKFIQTIYYEKIWRDYNDIFTVREKIIKVLKKYSKYGRVIVYPKYTLTYDRMMQNIEYLIRNEGFIPDILIIDYVDILDIPSHYDDYKKEDERWKLMARLAGTTGCLVITATQANKAGHKAALLDSTHQGGFYGKNRHVNLMVGLNQTPQQKQQGIMDFGITEGRGIWYVEGHTCRVLQDLISGQAYLDAYLPPYKNIVSRIA